MLKEILLSFLLVGYSTLSTSASEILPYEPTEDPYVPQSISALPETTVGIVRIPEYGGSEIAIYQGSAGSSNLATRYYYSPYIAISRSELLHTYTEKCADSKTLKEPFYLTFNVELGSARIAQEASDQLNGIDESAVGIFPYSLVELIDAKENNVIWRVPRNLDKLLRSSNTIPWGPIQSITQIDCDDLKRYSLYQDHLIARAIVPSASESNRVGRISVRQFRRHLLNFDTAQQAGTRGMLEQIGVTVVDGQSNTKPAILNLVVGGDSLGSVDTTVKSIEKDTRERWVNRVAFENAIRSYVRQVGVSTWCSQEDAKCSAKNMQEKLFNLLKVKLHDEDVPMFSEVSQPPYSAGVHLLIQKPAGIQRLREVSMNPSFSSEESGTVDCQAMRTAALATATGGSVPEVSNDKPAQLDSPETTPADTSPEKCGLNLKTTLKDKNNLRWSYTGAEWIPISIQLTHVSKDSFSGVEETVILESKYSGATNVLTPVPVIDRIEEGKQYVGSCRPEQAGVGGHRGHRFNPVVPEELQINFGGNVNGLIINGRPYGGTLGTKSKLLDLADGEYIDRVEVRYGRYLDWVLFRTNRGQVIKGGRDV